MNGAFLQTQWDELCERMDRTARHLAGEDSQRLEQYASEVKQFAEQSPPESYPDYLGRVREAASIAINWHTTGGSDSHQGAAAGAARGPAHATQSLSAESPDDADASEAPEPDTQSEELDPVKEAGDESFPASDPPSWTPSSL